MGAHSALLFAGGLVAVIYTDALQTLIMVLGAIVLAVKGRSWEDCCAPSALLGQSQINKKTQPEQFGGQTATVT